MREIQFNVTTKELKKKIYIYLDGQIKLYVHKQYLLI